MQLKLPSNASIEELLASLENSNPIGEDPSIPENYEFEDDTLNFIAAFKIEAGTTRIRTKLLYRIYRQWSPEPVTPHRFALTLSGYIPKETVFSLISSSIIDFSKLAVETLAKKKHRRRKNRVNVEYFRKFFDYYNIKPDGNLWLEPFVFHYLYVEWCDKFRLKRKYNFVNLTKTLKLFLPSRRTAKGWFFQVEDSVLKYLPQSKLDVLRKNKGKFHGRKEEQKKPG